MSSHALRAFFTKLYNCRFNSHQIRTSRGKPVGCLEARACFRRALLPIISSACSGLLYVGFIIYIYQGSTIAPNLVDASSPAVPSHHPKLPHPEAARSMFSMCSHGHPSRRARAFTVLHMALRLTAPASQVPPPSRGAPPVSNQT